MEWTAISMRGSPLRKAKPPGRVDRHADLDIEQTSDEAPVDGVLDRQHHRREAKLEVDRGLELALAADLEDLRRLVEIGPHRLLNEDARADRHALEHCKMRGRRRRDIKNRVVRLERLVERIEHPDAELL